MFKKLEIKNYRGFKQLNIEKLAGLNLFAGANNSGKTSLLEALFLLCGSGNAKMAMNSNVTRIENPPGPLHDAYLVWNSLFYQLNTDQSIIISAEHSKFRKLKLAIESKQLANIDTPLEQDHGFSVTNRFDEYSLTFLFNLFGNKQVVSHTTLKNGDVTNNQPHINVPFIAIILSSRKRENQEDADRLNGLRRRKQSQIVVEALNLIEPNLRSIEVSYINGIPTICGDIGLSELTPLMIMGEGTMQIARLILAIAHAPGGVVLIDELENGIHYSVLPQLWRVINKISKQFKTQIFATTHSFECISAGYENTDHERLLLHRLDRNDSGDVRCTTYDYESMNGAFDHDLEVR